MKKLLTRLLPWLITLLLIIYIIRQGGDLREFIQVLDKAKWTWLLLGILCQACSYGIVAWLNIVIIRHFGFVITFFRQFLIQLAVAFVTAVIPSASISGFVLRVRLWKPYGVPVGIATAATIVEIMLVTISIIMLGIITAGVAIVQGTIENEIIRQILIMILVAIAAIVCAWRLWPNKHSVHGNSRIIYGLCQIWDNVFVSHLQDRFGEWTSDWLLDRWHYLTAQLSSLLRTRPIEIGIILLTHLGFEALALTMCFFSFNEYLPVTTMLLIYILTLCINSLGSIPGGVGLAETSTAALYIQFGITPESAVAIALAYRVTEYWLPRAAGGLSWLWLERVTSLNDLK